jgi:hypothetical protein
MLIKRPDDLPASEITPRALFEERRRFLLAAASPPGLGARVVRIVPK